MPSASLVIDDPGHAVEHLERVTRQTVSFETPQGRGQHGIAGTPYVLVDKIDSGVRSPEEECEVRLLGEDLTKIISRDLTDDESMVLLQTAAKIRDLVSVRTQYVVFLEDVQ